MRERIGGGLAEIEMEAARRQRFVRDLAPFLIDDLAARFRRAEISAGRVRRAGVHLGHHHHHMGNTPAGCKLILRRERAIYLPRAAVGVRPKRRRKQRLK
jgi:hypothetical protein